MMHEKESRETAGYMTWLRTYADGRTAAGEGRTYDITLGTGPDDAVPLHDLDAAFIRRVRDMIQEILYFDETVARRAGRAGSR